MIQQKKKLCNNCNTMQFIWKNDKGNRYCKYCWHKRKEPDSKPLKVRKPINPKSKKMQAIDQAYSKIRKKFMLNKPVCEAGLPGCTVEATDVHHKKGRGQYHLDVNTWLSVCRSCHTWIEEHPKEAIELGYSEKRI
tara:strand:- start:146 stop:553 length:408 start_codon:yes stop_codon:yes gene_type:complete